MPYLENIVRQKSKTAPLPFIAITESWLKSYVEDAQISLEDYYIHRCDRGTRVGGGALLYTHRDLHVTNTETLDKDSCQLVMCSSEPSKLIVCVLYRPPLAPIEDFKACLESIHEYSAGKDDYDLCLLGDFNFPNISWETGITTSANPSTELFENFMAEHLFSQYVLQPTRNDNTLDLFLTTSAALVTHVDVSATELSDHDMVEIYLSYNPCHPNVNVPPSFEGASFRSLDFEKADFQGIDSDIQEIDWESLLETEGLENFPAAFSSRILAICQEHCPLKVPPKRQGSTKMRILSRKKRKLQQRLDTALVSPDVLPEYIEQLEDRISMLHYDIKDTIVSERHYREEQAVGKVKTNPKYFYSYAKKFAKQKQTISMLFDTNNDICTSPKQIADVLQNQFKSVFSDPDDVNVEAADFAEPNISKPFLDSALSFSEEDVQHAIETIKWDAAAGPDGIPASLLKSCKSTIARPIYLLWSKSFDEGIVPTYYKSSFICPLYKKGSRAIASNYRPVSLTSHVIKIFERVLRRQLVRHLESNDLLCSQQHGFRSGHSCLTQLLHHFDDILMNYLNGNDTDCIYLDYAKAFDKVDHNLLIKKMSKYGIHPKIVQWISSFLCGRTQEVVVEGHLSFAALIISGVPQGTVLGPILFLIFINDITLCISNSVIRCFADDTRIMRSISTCDEMSLLQQDLDLVIEWSVRNNMALHEDKFEYMAHSCNRNNSMKHFPFSSESYQYSTNKGMLAPVDRLRDLGITVCSDLNWTTHIKAITDKARKKAAWVFSVFHNRSPEIMLTLYKSLVRSLLEYCCPVWNPRKISDIQELEGVQRTFTSRIAGCQQLDYWERLQKLSLMSLQRRRERYIVLHMWKLLHGDVSNDIRIEFVSRPRTGIKAKVPSIRGNSATGNQSLYDNSFAVMGPRLWNCLPARINTISTFEQFKEKLTSLLMRVPDKPPVQGYSTQNTNSILDWRVDAATTDLWGGQDC